MIAANSKCGGRSRRTGNMSVFPHKLGTVRFQSPDGLHVPDFNNVSLSSQTLTFS